MQIHDQEERDADTDMIIGGNERVRMLGLEMRIDDLLPSLTSNQ